MYKGFLGNPVLLDQSVFAEVQGLNGDVGCRVIPKSAVRFILRY
jgi:CTP:molybdopterin cytidylyltransferase MocA